MRLRLPQQSGKVRNAEAALALGLVLVALCCMPVGAQLIPRTIGELDPRDLYKNERQRELVSELARRQLGSVLRGTSVEELDALQRLLDERHVRREDVYAQQAIGVVLGDIMVASLQLHWITVDDDQGHARALRYRQHEDIFFPVTMISKRVQASEPVSLRALYAAVEERVRVLKKRP